MILEIFPVGPLQCNCSIVGDEQTRDAVVIDPGDDISEVVRRISAHQLTVKQIIITHAHIDHIGGAAKLKQLTGAAVILNQMDFPLLQQLSIQALWIGVPVPEVVVVDESADGSSKLGLSTFPIQVLHTPGHTPGSICLYLPEQKMLFAGDTLFAGTIGRTDLPGGDARQILRSLHDKLLPLPDEVRVIPGHGWETVMGEEKQSNPFLQPGVKL